MPDITNSELHPSGSELFQDSDSYLHELSDAELNQTCGGTSPLCIVVVAGGVLLLSGCDKPKGVPAPGIGAP